MGTPVPGEVFIDDDMWPDVSDPVEVWVGFAVRRGVSRAAAQAMSKPDLIRALLRLDNTSE